jgi:hypothetical protein
MGCDAVGIVGRIGEMIAGTGAMIAGTGGRSLSGHIGRRGAGSPVGLRYAWADPAVALQSL